MSDGPINRILEYFSQAERPTIEVYEALKVACRALQVCTEQEHYAPGIALRALNELAKKDGR